MKEKTPGRGKMVVTNLLITLAVGLVYFYFSLPAINLQNSSFYTFFVVLALLYCVLSLVRTGVRSISTPKELLENVKKSCIVPAIFCVGLILFYLVGSLISAPIFRARSYRDLLTVENGDFAVEVEEISYDQIPMLDEDSAKRLGDRKLGELADMVSQFEVAQDYTQINYKGRPVRVTPLEYGDIIKWLNNRSAGLPGYLVIDMVTQNVEVVRLSAGDGIKYTTNEHFGRYLYRHLRFQYPTFMFDTATFEIDEEGVPYWVCPRIIRQIGLFGGTDIQGAVLVNAITGESVYYESLPSWVDRVYTADLIIEQYDYHGMYQNGWLNSIFGQRDVTVTTEGYNYIVSGDDVYMYTGITSVGGDESNVGFILSNQRTKETKYYPCAGAEEYSAMASAEGIVQQMKYVATFPLLLNIEAQPTYFMALKDSAGLVKMYAMVNVRQYQIVASGVTVAECQKNYLEQLHRNELVETGKESGREISGTVAELRSAVIDGNTHVYLRLEGEAHYYVISVSDAGLAAIVNVGDKVTITVSEGEGEIRQAYDLKR